MKNIHLISTDEPSRLFKDAFGKYFISINIDQEQNHFKPQHLYITSDEEIKEGDYCISHLNVIDEGKIHNTQTIFNPKTKEDLIALQSCKKIILTTDQDLDGVQAIDDTFLEWFVKNPSCEFVEVIKDLFQVNQNNPVLKGSTALVKQHKIIIPQEEPKQEIKLEDIFNDEKKQGVKDLIDAHKQATLEEVADMERVAMDKLKNKWGHLYTFGYPQRPFPTNYENDLNNIKIGLYEGAKYQAKRMYSEEEVLKLLLDSE
jgi:hypothetical protein